MKMRKKSDLPVKTCAACGRPMVWRKAWAKVWDEVKYCSDACRRRGAPSDPADPANRKRADQPSSVPSATSTTPLATEPGFPPT